MVLKVLIFFRYYKGRLTENKENERKASNLMAVERECGKGVGAGGRYPFLSLRLELVLLRLSIAT